MIKSALITLLYTLLFIPTEPLPVYEVTAYTLRPSETGGKRPSDEGYGITASGTYVTEGRTIACSKSIPFGTHVYIPYFDNTFVCEDTGNLVTDGKIDVFMDDLDEALAFGRRELPVVIFD